MFYKYKGTHNELIFQKKETCCKVAEKDFFELKHVYAKTKKEQIRPSIWWSREYNETVVHANPNDIIYVIEKDIYKTSNGNLLNVWHVIYGEKFGWMGVVDEEDFELIQ
jgi:hypothetical protein